MKRLLAPILVILLPDTVRAVEKWADSKMPVSQPLLWLDASSQKAAYQAHGRTLLNGGPVDVWYDASGQKRHALQRVQTMQPRFAEASGVGLVRFGGKEFLGRIEQAPPLEDFTLYLVSIPRSNPGGFQGWFALSALGKNDFQTGLNVDLAAAPTEKLTQINVEGNGFSSALNLLKTPLPFGRLQIMRVEGNRKVVRLFVEGKLQGERKRNVAPISMETLTMGARYYSNSTDPPFVHGFFDGDIAEVLLYGKALNDDESTSLDAYLKNKYAVLHKELVPPQA